MWQHFLSQENLLDVNISSISTPFKLIELLKEWNFRFPIWVIIYVNIYIYSPRGMLYHFNSIAANSNKTQTSLLDNSVQKINLL